MMADIMMILFIIIIGSLCLVWAVKDYKMQVNEDKFTIDKDTYDTAIVHLEKIIKFETIYITNAEMGNIMSSSIGATTELTNDQISDINNKVKVRVIECLSDDLRNYFIDNFGENWLLDYIKIYTLSMILSYSELSMTSLVYPQK